MKKEIAEVDYNEVDCWGEDNAVCPYCGYENYIEPENYRGQDGEDIEECGECGKNFIRQIDYSVTFTSEPLENYYLRRRQMLLNQIDRLKTRIENNEDSRHLVYMLEHYEGALEELKEEILPLLEEEEWKKK